MQDRKDSSGNTSSKDINVIVKERAAYTLPYVIEVIRNQSTTLVYGQDENGNYTAKFSLFSEVCGKTYVKNKNSSRVDVTQAGKGTPAG